MSEELFVGGVESRKLKRKIEETSSNDVADSGLLLSLSLGNNKIVDESTSKFICKSLKSHNDSPKATRKPLANTNNQLITPKQHQFSCKFCDKKFSTCQALGGHQNAHRHERVLSRMDREFDMRIFGHNHHIGPYSAMAHHYAFRGPMPLYCGTNMHPMANMSAMPWSHSIPGYGNQRLHTTSIPTQRFEMNNPWAVAAETPQNVYHRDVGFGFEHNQVSSLNVPNRAIMAHAGLSGLLGNQYTGNEQLSFSRPDLSRKL